ncbi:hypothetical protein AXFE_14290 [Acidithrix ferrooxidans]|uniref:Uncharacterized protein n=1 Tax=Acidithrix ferrooxidans TaxID=1280514 RepID=A0A0D8HKW9_9ACTN|nr:hypothetical protein AXFE_14290 [Acidithrix ferrooxidans]
MPKLQFDRIDESATQADSTRHRLNHGLNHRPINPSPTEEEQIGLHPITKSDGPTLDER